MSITLCHCAAEVFFGGSDEADARVVDEAVGRPIFDTQPLVDVFDEDLR
jgi:hypothetical protein